RKSGWHANLESIRMNEKFGAQVEETFFAAVELPEEARTKFFNQVCAEWPGIRREVEPLLPHEAAAKQVNPSGLVGPRNVYQRRRRVDWYSGGRQVAYPLMPGYWWIGRGLSRRSHCSGHSICSKTTENPSGKRSSVP